MEGLAIFVLLLVSLHIQIICTAEIDIISDLHFLKEGDKLVSPGGTFELGFFKPGSSGKSYLGIWYKKISVQTVVWVANRNRPLTVASSGVLRIVHGNLVLMNDTNGALMWSSNTTSSGNATAKLDDTGNLVMTHRHNKRILWQSFDYPTDTHLPGMMFGRDLLTRRDWYLSSWKSSEDPAPGEFTFSIDTHGYPQDILKQGPDVIKYRTGPWNGIRFSGASAFNQNTIFTYNMVINKTMVTYTYNLVNSSVVTRFTLISSGDLQSSVWVEDAKRWQVTVTLPRGDCDFYNNCGAYGSCSTATSQVCSCLDETKFVPRNPKGWNEADWSGGCVRRTPLECKKGTDGFIRYANVKWPDTHTSWYNMSMTLKECAVVCLKNCTCMAYANTNITGEGSGCLLWFNELKDIRVITEGNGGQDIFVRMASSELVSKNRSGTHMKFILLAVFLGVLLIGLSSTLFCYTLKNRHHAQPMGEGESIHVYESQKEVMELPLFSFSTVAQSTCNFSPGNKLGEGGFGSVYKGVLEGKEIAVKRLSTTSSQGTDEFKNEVICISKLQHRNLVKLLGFSIEGDEKLLIYEYMPNRSLDFFIFDKTQSTLLDWTKRFHIIEGIARGLLYLHQDSRLRIIHRDLKASNILLDPDMNPKISDFGIARSFGGHETQANTERVVGTYGYMSPEYALDGIFSTKSDVFSFGVLVLEIVSGSRNRGFIHTKHDSNLIGHAWRMYKEGRSMELIDSSLDEPSNSSEVLRSIEVGLLCVQQNPEDRPDMSSVVRMLGSEGALLKPKQPAFFTERNLHGADFSSSTDPTSSSNGFTVTEVVAR